MVLYVEMVLKINYKVFLNLNQNILNLKNIKNDYMVKNIKTNVIIIYYVQLIMICIFKKEVNQHYLFSMTNDIKKMILNVYHGIEYRVSIQEKISL